MESRYNRLQLENSQLNSFVTTCVNFGEEIVNEIQRDFLSKTFLRENRKYLESLKVELRSVAEFEKICTFYSNMQVLLTYLENHATGAARKSMSNMAQNGNTQRGNLQRTSFRQSLQDRMNDIVLILSDVIQGIGNRGYVQGVIIKTELDRALSLYRAILDDVIQVQEGFKKSHRQKRKLESEVLSMIHAFQEIRRLEREVKEKQCHISELNRESQMLRKKARQQHRKQIDSIHLKVEEKKIQLRELQKSLERHLGSADTRMHALVALLPDLDQNDNFPRSDTELTSNTSGSNSRLATPHTVVKETGLSAEEDNDVTITRSGLINSVLPPQTPVTNHDSSADMETKADPETSNSPRKIDVSVSAEGNSATQSSVPNSHRTSEKQTNGRLLDRRAQQTKPSRNTHGASKSRTPHSTTNLARSKISKQAPNKEKKDKQPEKTDPEEEPSKGKSDNESDIDRWVAMQKTRSKTEELHRKLASFTVIETEDRTEEIRKLGRTLADDYGKVQPQSTEDAEPDKDAGTPNDEAASPEGDTNKHDCQSNERGCSSPQENSVASRSPNVFITSSRNLNVNHRSVTFQSGVKNGGLEQPRLGSTSDHSSAEGEGGIDVAVTSSDATLGDSHHGRGDNSGIAVNTRNQEQKQYAKYDATNSSATTGATVTMIGEGGDLTQRGGTARHSLSSMLMAGNTDALYQRKPHPMENRAVLEANVIQLRLPHK